MQDKFYKIIALMLELADEMETRVSCIEKALETKPGSQISEIAKLKAPSKNKLAS